MSRRLDVENVDAALKRAADKAIHGTREERAGRFGPVQSSTITFVRYRDATHELEITFTSGNTFRYIDVPLDVYLGLLNAESKGAFFASKIKDAFAFAQVTNGPR